MGPKVIRQLKDALDAKGFSLAVSDSVDKR
jgi:hypothetical protein